MGTGLRVLVEATAGLAAGAPGGDRLDRDLRRLPPRLAEALLIEGSGDVEPDVDPDEVHQLERAHAKAAPESACAVDLLHRGHPLAEQLERLKTPRPVAAVDQEARSVRRVDDALAHGLAAGARDGESARGGLGAGDHLQQCHQRRRVEEVHAHDPLGMLRGGGQGGHEQRRRVARQDAVAGDDLRQPAEQLVLELHALGGGLDDESQSASSSSEEAGRNCALAASAAPDSMRPLLTSRSSWRRIRLRLRSRASGSGSWSSVCMPATHPSWAIPAPIVPAPATPSTEGASSPAVTRG